MPSARAPSIVAISSARPRRHGARIARLQLVQERRLPHRLEHVEIVVAGGAVGAEADARRRRRASRRPWRCRSPASCCSRDCATRRRGGAPGSRCRPASPRRRARRASAAPRSRSTRGTASASRLCSRLEVFTSSAVSARWISTGACLRSASARTAFSVAVSSVYIACGATAGTIRSSPANSLMNASARASPSAGVFASATGNWMIVWPSTPRRPASLVDAARSPPRSSTCRRRSSSPTGSSRARPAACRRARTPARRSSPRPGKMYFCSQSISARSSASPRYSTIGAWVWVLIEAGHHDLAGGVDRSRGREPGRNRLRRCRRRRCRGRRSRRPRATGHGRRRPS